ncbi:hypothetical protein SDC9_194905 [bioreactor metagenome]|uniref:Uncharacterized protein n=1 Tax=bioreactor metagenome TaxID=1076179 RepID=A0A645IIY4_9ZZZZ
MKYQSTDNNIHNVTQLIKEQNRAVKIFAIRSKKRKQIENEKIYTAIDRFNNINNYVVKELLPALQKIKDNDRYVFQYIDDTLEPFFDLNAKYFKIIIKNKVNNIENFFIASYNINDFLVKMREPNSKNENAVIEHKLPIVQASKNRFREIFFNYFESIIKFDSLLNLK